MSWSYMRLAHHVPEEIPLYGLQSRGLDGKEEFARSLTEMAADYIEQIRRVQPTGPYHLLGWSFGGIAAHEMAVQLRAAGDEVAALVILDTYPEELEAGAEPELRSPEEAAEALEARIDWVRREAGDVFGAISDDEVMLLARLFQNNVTLQARHHHTAFDGDMLLLVAGRTRPLGMPTTRRWAPYVAGEIAETRLPCRHPDMPRPEMLGQVWSAISDWLNRRNPTD